MSRRQRLCVVGLLGLFLAMMTGAASGQEAALPAGVKAVWDMSKAHHETTATRERICINGLWRWQPAAEVTETVPNGGWGYFKVPGPWPGINQYMQKNCQTAYPHPSWKGQNLSQVVVAWYQREIEIPRNWQGRRITVTTEYLNSYAAVYVDGKKVGEMLFPWGEVDITSVCKPGRKQVLSLCTKAAPLSSVVMAYTDTGAPKRAKGSVSRRGLCGDVHLVSTPKDARVSNVKVDPSVRKWEIGFDVALDELQTDKEYRLRAQVTDKGKKVKEFVSTPFRAANLKEGRFAFTNKWKPDKLWDVHTPQNTYHVQVTLVDSGNKALDVFGPVRFGFREFWIKGRDYYLNGTRFYSSLMGTENGQLGAAWSTYEAARETFLRDKSFGINTVYTHNYGCQPGSHVGYKEILRAADDVGMLISFSQPHYGHYKWTSTKNAETNGYARHAEFYVRMAQNHPSVVMYSMNHNALSYGGGKNPDVIDGLHNEKHEIGPRLYRGAKNGMLVQSVVERFDRTRVVYHHSSCNLGNMYTLNLYLNWTPIQEVSDWFEHWSKKGVKPLLLCEFDTPYDFEWSMYRGWYEGKRSFGSRAVPWEFCVGEWNSQFLGDRSFQLSEVDKINLRWEANKWKTSKPWKRWTYPYAIVGKSSRGHNHKNEVRSMYITDNWRAFRTYGVSATNEFGYSPFWHLHKGVKKERQNFKVDWDNIQKPGFSPDYVDSPYERMDLGFEKEDWIAGAAAQALIRNNLPLLAYIAGKPEHFTTKDHNFLAGESFTKQIIIINNSRETVTADCSWSLALPRPVRGVRKVTIETGNQERIPMGFALPAGVKPRTYELAMTVRFSTGETQTDTFGVNVVPPVPSVKAGTGIALFDPKGETARLLKKMGVRCTSVGANANLDRFNTLIVGKGAITLDGPAPDISRVRDGLKVILFEQTAEVMEKRFGFRVQEYGLRNVFPRVPDHPLLAGITTESLRDWRGQSTLLPDRLTGYTIFRRTGECMKKRSGIDVRRGWRCGNWGNVTSALIEKPARGDFLPIVDGGYSLQYSPLMVYREGRGLMVLCQMDVTGRTEDEPVARRLVTNILDYVAGYAPAPRRTVLYAGEQAGQTLLKQTGLTLGAYEGGKLTAEQVLIVGPGGARSLAANAQAVRDWVRAGGHLFAIGLSQQEANSFLPFAVKTRKAEHIGTVFAPLGARSLLAGVGSADVHNRDPREMDLLSGGVTVVGDGVLAVAANANVVFSQMAPWQFDYKKRNAFLPAYNQKRTFRRTACLVARVLGNMGAGASTPLLERLSSPVGADEKGRWLQGLYLDIPQEQDDPYRYFGW